MIAEFPPWLNPPPPLRRHHWAAVLRPVGQDCEQCAPFSFHRPSLCLRSVSICSAYTAYITFCRDTKDHRGPVTHCQGKWECKKGPLTLSRRQPGDTAWLSSAQAICMIPPPPSHLWLASPLICCPVNQASVPCLGRLWAEIIIAQKIWANSRKMTRWALLSDRNVVCFIGFCLVVALLSFQGAALFTSPAGMNASVHEMKCLNNVLFLLLFFFLVADTQFVQRKACSLCHF